MARERLARVAPVDFIYYFSLISMYYLLFYV